jgi:hypothetical protein
MIAAIENARDAAIEDSAGTSTPDLADFDFRQYAQNNQALYDADGYLTDGMTECICPDPDQLARDRAYSETGRFLGQTMFS